MKNKTKPFDTNLTDAEFKARIISALRQSSRWWKPKQEAINRAKVSRGMYKCEDCWKIWPPTLPPEKGKKRRRKNCQADHIYEVVPITWFWTYDEWIKRCFVWAEWFQAICWECHTKKTKQENKDRRDYKKWIEVWRRVVEFPDKDYYVSTMWRVRNWEKILKPQSNWQWYLVVWITPQKRKIHRLVANAFIWNIEWLVVCHKDDNWENNRVENLFIGTIWENNSDRSVKWRNAKPTPIFQYSKDWDFIREWKWWSLEIERELWFNCWNINNCCNWKQATSMWFIWRRNKKKEIWTK